MAKRKSCSVNATVTIEKLILTAYEWKQLRDEIQTGFLYYHGGDQSDPDRCFVVFRMLIGSDPPRYFVSNLISWQSQIPHYLPLIDSQFNYLVEHLGEVVAQTAEALVVESEVWEYCRFSEKAWKREYESLNIDGLYGSAGRMRELQAKWADAARKRWLGYGDAHIGNSKVKMRISIKGREGLRTWYKLLKPICLRVRKAHVTRGDVKAAAKLFDNKRETGIAYLDSHESYLDDDLIKALNEHKPNRQFKYKPYQVAAVAAARLTTSLGLDMTFRGFTKISMSQVREIMRLISKR